MTASKEPILVGGWAPSTRLVQVKVTARAWWISMVTPLGPVTVTPSKRKLVAGDSGTAQKMPGPLAPLAVEAVMFRSVMFCQ